MFEIIEKSCAYWEKVAAFWKESELSELGN